MELLMKQDCSIRLLFISYKRRRLLSDSRKSFRVLASLPSDPTWGLKVVCEKRVNFLSRQKPPLFRTASISSLDIESTGFFSLPLIEWRPMVSRSVSASFSSLSGRDSSCFQRFSRRCLPPMSENLVEALIGMPSLLCVCVRESERESV